MDVSAGEDAKQAMRSSVLRGRRELSETDHAVRAEAIAAHLLAAPFARVPRIGVYLSMASEPGTAPLVDGLLARGAAVVVPRTRPDWALDWVEYDPAGEFTVSALGVREPVGPGLGATALADVDLVIVPALAVDVAGWRLGRGRGYFDRALSHTKAPACALVYSDELLPAVPHSEHDVPVDLVVTENGVFRVPESG